MLFSWPLAMVEFYRRFHRSLWCRGLKSRKSFVETTYRQTVLVPPPPADRTTSCAYVRTYVLTQCVYLHDAPLGGERPHAPATPARTFAISRVAIALKGKNHRCFPRL